MPLSTSALVLQGTLLLSTSHPAQIKNTANDLWFSNPKLIEAQAVGSGVVLRSKGRGIVHAVGLSRSSSTPQRILVTSDANVAASKRCPKASVDLSTSPPHWTGELSELESTISRCGFDELSLAENLKAQLEGRLTQIERELGREGFAIYNPHWEEGRRILVTAPSSRARVLKRMGPLSAFLEIEERDMPKPGRTLIFEITLFEISKNDVQELGIDWPRALGLKLNTQPGARFELPSALDFAARLSEAHSIGRVLAQPMIRTKPGEKASFQSGGELPIRNVSVHSSSTTWKSYGLILNLEPDASAVTGASEVALNFKVELSEPDFSSAIDGVPGMIVRKLESRFDLRTNETTILTTMVQSRQGTRREGVPGLLSIPFLGSLFSSRGRNDQASELCFAIRPTWDEALPTPQGFPRGRHGRLN